MNDTEYLITIGKKTTKSDGIKLIFHNINIPNYVVQINNSYDDVLSYCRNNKLFTYADIEKFVSKYEYKCYNSDITFSFITTEKGLHSIKILFPDVYENFMKTKTLQKDE